MTMVEQSADCTQSDDPKREIKFFVLGNHSFGNGSTFDEAIKNNRDAGGDRFNLVYMWTGPEYPHKAVGGPFGFKWEGTTNRPVLIQDNRRVGDRFTMNIGEEVV